MMYLDNAATSPIKNSVVHAITQSMDYYGNPSSLYKIGRESKSIIDDTKKSISKLVNCNSNEIIFTSSGSEADNMALKGFYFAHINEKCTIITSTIEHKAILNSCEFLSRIGANVKYVGVDKLGKIDINELYGLCREATGNLLVSIQFANNEIGTIQDIKIIADIVHKYNGIFHTDAVQAFPEIQIDVQNLNIDMMSVSGHKFGAPKGIGFLYKRSNIAIEPLIHGGKQEFGIRAGTENVPYIVGIKKAISILPSQSSIEELKTKRNYFINRLMKIDGCIVNGDIENRLANNINVSFKSIEGESLVLLLDMYDIYVSSGSACSSGDINHNYVLKAIGVDNEYINGTIRISINNDISYDDIDNVVKIINNNVKTIRRFTC